jgi:hypothetical protein
MRAPNPFARPAAVFRALSVDRICVKTTITSNSGLESRMEGGRLIERLLFMALFTTSFQLPN